MSFFKSRRINPEFYDVLPSSDKPVPPPRPYWLNLKTKEWLHDQANRIREHPVEVFYDENNIPYYYNSDTKQVTYSYKESRDWWEKIREIDKKTKHSRDQLHSAWDIALGRRLNKYSDVPTMDMLGGYRKSLKRKTKKNKKKKQKKQKKKKSMKHKKHSLKI